MKHLMYITLCLLAVLAGRAQTVSHNDTVGVYTMHGTYYSDRFVGRKTSSGEVFNQNRYTAAHKTLKFGTLLLVTNIHTGQQVIVRVNDRCPRSNVLDMTRKAAKQLGIGSQKVNVQVLPERYYTYWEHQEEMKDVLIAGNFWNYVKQPERAEQILHHSTAKAAENKSTTTQKSSSTKNGNVQHQSTQTSKAEKAEEHSVAKEPLYDLELGHYASRNTAQKATENLPLYYRDLTGYRSDVNRRDITLVLQLEAPKSRAEEVQKELQSHFPEVKMVQSKK